MISYKKVHPSKINRADRITLIALALGLIYSTITEPLLVCFLGIGALAGMSLWRIIHSIPLLEYYLGGKVRFWHIAVAICTASAFGGLLAQPADAAFLSGLEALLKDITKEAAAAGGTSISDDVISLIFNMLRGIFLLLVAASALFAYNQAQQGNDWRPIATQIGLAFGIVLGLDVITFLFVGGATTPTPPVP